MAGKTNRKYGRNSTRGQAKRYAAENRLARNKEARRLRTAKRQPNNAQIQLEKPEQRQKFDAEHRIASSKRWTTNTANWLHRARATRAKKGLTEQEAVDRFPGRIDPRLVLSTLLKKKEE